MSSSSQISPLILIAACMGGGFLAVIACVLFLRPAAVSEQVAADSVEVTDSSDLDSSEVEKAVSATSARSASTPVASQGSVAVGGSSTDQVPVPEQPVMKADASDASVEETVGSVSNDDSAAVSARMANSTGPSVTDPASSKPVIPETAVAVAATEPMPPETSPDETLDEELPNIAGPEKRPVAQVDAEPPPREVPPIPDEIEPIEYSRFGDIRKMISLEKRATDAHALHEAFAQSFEFKEAQQKLVDRDSEEWKERAEQNLYRLGTNWVPKEEVEAAVLAAEKILEKADELLDQKQYKEAVELYEEASRVDPNGVRADYTLGLVYSLPFAGVYGVDKAELHFRRVLAREPDYAAAHNSLGIAHVKQAKFLYAVSDFERAAELLMYSPEVVQNLGRLRHLTELLHVDARSLSRCQELYDKLIAEEKGQPFDPSTGWLHMVPVFSEAERSVDLNEATATAPVSDPAGMLAPSLYATGFLVAPNYVLTARKAVYTDSFGRADQVRLRDRSGRERTGTVIALSDQADLALLYFPQLSAYPLQLSPQSVGVGAPLKAYHVPRGSQSSALVQPIDGSVSSLVGGNGPHPPSYGLSHFPRPGADGAPLLGPNGEVLGVLTRDQSSFAQGGGANAIGIPSQVVAEFLQRYLGQLAAPQQIPGLDSTQRQSLVTSAVFPITSYYRSGVQSVATSATSVDEGEKPYEDYTCPICNGLAKVKCNAPKCSGGSVRDSYFITRMVGPAGAQKPVQKRMFRKVDCLSCQGGFVDCSHCDRGFDLSLRGSRY